MDEQIKLLKAREKEIIDELEVCPSVHIRQLEEDLYELRDTLEKLENKEPKIYDEYITEDKTIVI